MHLNPQTYKINFCLHYFLSCDYFLVSIYEIFLNCLLPLGFIFIVNPFMPGTQWQWIEKCIKVYPCEPNVCNLDAHMERASTDTIWNQSTSSER